MQFYNENITYEMVPSYTSTQYSKAKKGTQKTTAKKGTQKISVKNIK